MSSSPEPTAEFNIKENFNKYRYLVTTNKYAVLDVETTLVDKTAGTSVFTHTPEFVMGYVNDVYNRVDTFAHTLSQFCRSTSHTSTHLYVGHNITYDMLYFPREVVYDRDFYIWDTMLAEYLLSNQEVTMPSLDELARRYELPHGKLYEVSEMIKKDTCPSTIDEELLSAYLVRDVELTQIIYEKQREQFLEKPLAWQNMFVNQMIFRVNTWKASANGMCVKVHAKNKATKDLKEEVNTLYEACANLMAFLAVDADNKVPWNPNSVQHLQAVIYGGTVKYTEDECIGTYKTGAKAGKPKYKKVIKEVVVSSLSTTVGFSGTDEKTLKALLVHLGSHSGTGELIDTLLKYRDLNKTLTTYFEGYLGYADHDNYVHCQYNHGITPTGRITCSKPNLQNIKSDD